MKNTNRMPFSNGTQFMAWKRQNCDQCDQYEAVSTERSKSKCRYAYDLDFAQGSGEIPISTINYFGYAKDYHLANCPRLHCGRIKNHTDLQKAEKEAEKKKKTELPLEF